MTPEGLIVCASDFTPKETMDRLAAAVAGRAIPILARINHAAAAADVGMELRPTEVLIFGNPLAGTPLMQAAQTIGIDLPLTALVWQDETGGGWLAYNDPAWLGRRHGINPRAAETIGAMTTLLALVAKEATSSERRPPTALSPAAASTAADPGDTSGQPSRMIVQKVDTAVVFIDPQNDVLSERGTSWGAVGASVIENKTRENMERIFEAAKANGYYVFISPHYFYPTDSGWKFNGPLEIEEFKTHTFARSGPLDLAGFSNSGADWLDRFKSYINDGKTVVVSPHKVWGPQTNDLVLQLRKRGIKKVILGGMLANICVESHLRELLEQGFEVAVVKDATAGPRHPVWGDGYQAAMINYQFLAHGVWSTNETVARMQTA